MAFGFPAAYLLQIEFNADRYLVRKAVAETLDTLGWSYESPYPDRFNAKVPLNGSSWGERLTVSFVGDGKVEIESKCLPIPQVFDWGKNRKNVEQFLELMSAKVERISKFQSLDDPPFDITGATPLERALSDETTAYSVSKNLVVGPGSQDREQKDRRDKDKGPNHLIS